MTETRRPLDGIVVLSLADHYPGPFAAMLLSDWGADVINVERPSGDPARAFPAFHAALARGKRSVVLDLKDSDALGALHELVRTADVILEGYRPGVARRLEVDYESLRVKRADLVYVSISGFGQNGPYRDRPAHDLNVQALAGVVAQDPNVRSAAVPQPARLAVADLAAGHATAQAVLLGLVRRDRTGEGSYVDVSMFDAAVALLATDVVPASDPTAGPGLEYEAGYGIFTCADGRALTVGIANEDHFWKALVDETGLDPELRHLAGAERIDRRSELQRELAARFRSEPCQAWQERLVARGVPVGVVQDLRDLIADPQVAARAMLVGGPDGGDTRFARQPLSVDGQRWGPRAGVPELGAHTRDVLTEAGIAAPLVDELTRRAAGVSLEPTRQCQTQP